MKRTLILVLALVTLLAFSACTTKPTAVNPQFGEQPSAAEAEDVAVAAITADQEAVAEEAATRARVTAQEADVSYTLVTSTASGMAFVGQGGDIDGEVNPTLTAEPGDVVAITLINGDGVMHDFAIEELGVQSEQLTSEGAETTVVFTVDEAGEYEYFCSLPGHRQAGMSGTLLVGSSQEGEAAESEESAQVASVVHNPADVPEPIGDRGPQTVRVDLVARELEAQLAEGTTYTYWTFNGTVPGPFIRVRVGDTVELTLTNEDGSMFPHSIDLHAVNGPGGGEVYTQTVPGETTSFTFTALNPGLYVYHCATPSVANHISNGMYGLILVEPEGGLPEVDREFYVMQGELYTVQPFGESGHADFSHEKMLAEQPEYYTFNGAVGALTSEENALRAEVGETVRIFFGVGGPNATSSFHVIGEIFDRAYPFASLTSDPLTNVQTITVPPGGATMVEFTIEEPGTYILVDHALSRVERGLAGHLIAEGEETVDVFHEGVSDH